MLKAVRGTHQAFTDKEKAELARRVTEDGIISAIHYFTKVEGQKAKTNNVPYLPVLYMDGKVSIFRNLLKTTT